MIRIEHAIASRERSFQEGGSWRDSIRVNLSTEERLLVLFAQWPTDTEPSEKSLKELLKLVDLEPGSEAG